MLARPNGFLTLAEPVRKPSRVTLEEAAAGIVDWWARVFDSLLSDRLAWVAMAIVFWLLTLLAAYNTGLHAR